MRRSVSSRWTLRQSYVPIRGLLVITALSVRMEFGGRTCLSISVRASALLYVIVAQRDKVWLPVMFLALSQRWPPWTCVAFLVHMRFGLYSDHEWIKRFK